MTDILLSDEQITRLVKTARLPAKADHKAFASGIRQAVKLYASERTRNDVWSKRDIVSFAKLVKRVAEGSIDEGAELSEKFSALPQKMKELLDMRVSNSARTHLRTKAHSGISPQIKSDKVTEYILKMPTSEELRDPATTQKAANDLWGLLQHGSQMQAGRNRPTGNLSRPTIEPIMWMPHIGRGQPHKAAAETLVMWLASAWHDATGKLPALTANHRAHGPFVRLVKGTLDIMGDVGVDPVEVINKYGRKAKRAKHNT